AASRTGPRRSATPCGAAPHRAPRTAAPPSATARRSPPYRTTPGRAGSGRPWASAADRRAAERLQVPGVAAQVLERRVVGLAVVEAVVDLLHDHRQPEQAEHLVERPVSGGEAHPRAVVVDDLLPGGHAGQVRWLLAGQLPDLVVVGLHPVRHQAGEV